MIFQMKNLSFFIRYSDATLLSYLSLLLWSFQITNLICNFLPKFIDIINFSIAYILHISTSSAFLKKHAPFHEIERKLYLEK